MTFFQINYCDYNHSNMDCDMINRPNGSGDYLFLYFLTPMKVYFGQEMTIAQKGAFLLFPPDSPQIYQAVKKFTNSYIHFDISGNDFCTQYQIPVNKIVYPNNPEILNEVFRKINIEYFKLTGATTAEKRVQYMNEFNANDRVKIFLISLKAGGTGLNLIGADTIIHLDPWWNVASENQASDRAYRIGQTRNVEVIKLILENSIEERVIELQQIKKDLIDKVISDDDSSITNLSKEDIEFLLQ